MANVRIVSRAHRCFAWRKWTTERLAFLCVMFGWSISPFAAARSLPPVEAAKIDQLFSEWDRKDSPGCSLGVIRDGELAYTEGYGMASLEYGVALSDRSVFRMASVSKQFAATAIFLAEQRGHLSLDDDVREHVPELPDYGVTVTIRHLIHHTSGIRDYLTLMGLAGARDEDYYTDGDVLDALARADRLNFQPGTEYLYSNAGYFLLSVILPRATGKSLREFARDEMFAPLKMNESHFHDRFREVVPNRAEGYRPAESDGFETHRTTLKMVGDGGLYTTVRDLMKWDQNFYTADLGGRELIERLERPDRFNDGSPQSYAAGLGIGEYRGLKTISHGGSFVGYRTYALRFPKPRVSVYLLCNLSSISPGPLSYRVADIVLKEEFTEPREAEWNALTGLTLTESDRADLEGTYLSDASQSLAGIERDGDALQFVEGFGRWEIKRVSETEFRVRLGETRLGLLRWDRDARTLELHSHGQRSFLFRLVEPVSLSTENLIEYAGRYSCPELPVGYEVALSPASGERPIHLSVRVGRLEPRPIEPVFVDGFRFDGGTLVFRRDRDGRVRGFALSAGRARGFDFTRR